MFCNFIRDIVAVISSHIYVTLLKLAIMYPTLPKFEIAAYFVLWLGLYGWAIFQVFLLSMSKQYKRHGVYNGDLELVDEFFIPNNLKDTTDYEWDLWNHWLLEMILYSYTSHFCVMRVTELFAAKYRFHASMLFTFGFSLYFFGWQQFLFLVVQSLLCFSVAYLTKSVKATWIACVASMCAFGSSYATRQLDKMFDDHYTFVTFVCASSTCALRYTAFCLEYCWESNVDDSKKNKDDKLCAKGSLFQTLESLFLYQFYFPLFTGGPILNCNNFLNQINKEPVAWSWNIILQFTFGIFRYSFWHVFNNAFLHYFYFGSMHYDEKWITSVPMLTLCGLALCNVQFFCLKYVVLYGFPAQIAVADNLVVPGAAHCVSAKHKFTFMWKYFDKGLHKWLVRYIFIPLGGANKNQGIISNFFISMLVFGFVYVWHGLRNNHLVWATLNWLGVFIEKVADEIYKRPAVQEFEKKHLSPSTSRRLRAAISTPLFGLLILSNIYFLSGIQITNIYMKRVYTEDILSTFLVHLVLYFGAQCSMEFTRLGI